MFSEQKYNAYHNLVMKLDKDTYFAKITLIVIT